MKKILLAAVMFVLCFQTAAYCQTDSTVLKNAVSKIRTEITERIIEKAYLHFDRPYPYYVAGDAVYFKAYVTMGERHEPSKISGILHVDLINRNDVTMQSIAVQLVNGAGWGDFSLPDTLQKGSYRIRAYTQWMRNGKQPYFYDQYISVSSINGVDKVADATRQTALASLQFFPEGGNLVADIQSKVAFKAIGTTGLGVNVKGIILDNENKEVAKIASTHMGMGAFEFIPEVGRAYKAKVTYGDGTQATVALPTVEGKGITLAVNTDDPSKVSIEIKANRDYYKENLNKDLNMVIYWGGSVRTVKTKLDNAVLGLDLPAANFRTGVMQVTLFSQSGEPLNERLLFIQNNDLLNLSLNTNKPSFAKRENVQLNFNAKGKDGNPASGSYSVSVIDESKILVDENAENTILTNLLLTSDVKGYVEKPNYYFANVTKQSRADLDVLMLTQGYRRFVWKTLLSDNPAVTAAAFKPEQFLNISGTLKTKAGVPLADNKITLFPQAGGPVLSGVTDAQGHFDFENINYLSGTKFILKTQSSTAKNSVLTLDRPAPAPVVSEGNALEAKYNTNADILASLQNNLHPGVMTASNDKVMLKADNGVAGPQRKDAYRSSNLGGAGHADQVIKGDDIRTAPTLSSALNGVARGVDFQQGVPFLKTSQVVALNRGESEPMGLVIDGTLTSGSVDIVNPSAVETVEILKSSNASIYGVAGGAGIIVITTRQGEANSSTASSEMSPGVFAFTPNGFYKAKEFYAPRYDASAPASKIPDSRTTIFWKPDVSVDADGNASFSFFNADGTGNYRVVVEGMDNKGNLGRQVFKYKVE
jgi:hypothetical protein